MTCFGCKHRLPWLRCWLHERPRWIHLVVRPFGCLDWRGQP